MNIVETLRQSGFAVVAVGTNAYPITEVSHPEQFWYFQDYQRNTANDIDSSFRSAELKDGRYRMTLRGVYYASKPGDCIGLPVIIVDAARKARMDKAQANRRAQEEAQEVARQAAARACRDYVFFARGGVYEEAETL